LNGAQVSGTEPVPQHRVSAIKQGFTMVFRLVFGGCNALFGLWHKATTRAALNWCKVSVLKLSFYS